ncbi:hypothetical protein [Oceanihabitans sediminis]|uniref:hypothetical protein n=1 Tax=Oceanihabitans sediminis TaxID=1812012 RepID=UPI00299E3738|nr:hypothetical protein [Oceanihabitans sediminis]MDX1279463.1 hypothetical protein [Oceanihabitans sediminis]
MSKEIDLSFDSYTYIPGDSPEAIEIEVYHNGRKITNVFSMTLEGVGFEYEQVTNWKEKIENENY